MPGLDRKAIYLVMLYATVAVSWLAMSKHIGLDSLLSGESASSAQIWNGAFFIVSTCLLLYALVVRSIYGRAQELEKEMKATAAAKASLANSRQRLRRLASELDHAKNAQSRELAEYLHDTTAQELAIALLTLNEAKRALHEENQDAANAALNKAIDRIERSSEEVRCKVRKLNPMAISDVDLGNVLQAEAAKLTAEAGIRFEYHCVGSCPELSPDKAGFIYRACREFVINAIKHAEARLVRVRLQYSNGHIDLSVIDDGRGLGELRDNILQLEDRFGLFSIQESALNLGALLTFEEPEDGGTMFGIRLAA